MIPRPTLTVATPKKRNPFKRGYVPELPPGYAYEVTGAPERVTSHLQDANHVQAIQDACEDIQTTDAEMIDLERKLTNRIARLNDPALLLAIPADDVRRLEAEDVAQELDDRYARLIWTIDSAVGVIGSHMSYVNEEEQERIAMGIDPRIVERVRMSCPGVLSHAAWRLIAELGVCF